MWRKIGPDGIKKTTKLTNKFYLDSISWTLCPPRTNAPKIMLDSSIPWDSINPFTPTALPTTCTDQVFKYIKASFPFNWKILVIVRFIWPSQTKKFFLKKSASAVVSPLVLHSTTQVWILSTQVFLISQGTPFLGSISVVPKVDVTTRFSYP